MDFLLEHNVNTKLGECLFNIKKNVPKNEDLQKEIITLCSGFIKKIGLIISPCYETFYFLCKKFILYFIHVLYVF